MIARTPNKDQKQEFIRFQTSLGLKLTAFFERYLALFPALSTAEKERATSLDLQKIYLPSHFGPTRRTALGLNALGKLEERLRVAQAHESLEMVRDYLGLKRSLVKAKKTSIRGYTLVTRLENAIQNTEKLLRRARVTYNRAYNSLKSLGAPMGLGTEAGPLEVLKEGDLRHLRDWTKDGRVHQRSGGLDMENLWSNG